MHDFFNVTNIIHKKQSGFRKYHSCNTALTHLMDTWLKDVDSGKYVGSVFLDLRKAFDLVDHQILIHKLKLHHFSEAAVAFSNRTQVVKVGNTQSDTMTITSGVPQGSILGPLLFLVYINDLADVCTDVNLDLYADDSTSYKSGSNIHEIEVTLQESLNQITNWCTTNNMLLHPTKSKCMVIGSRYKLNKINTLQLTINGTTLENVTHQKLLGIHVDNSLKWHIQIDNVCQKLNSKVNLLKRIKCYLNRHSRVLFYNAYILPIMDYCCHIWGKENKACINQIHKIQSRICKIMLDLPMRSTSKSIYEDLQIMSFDNRCMYHVAVLVFKTLITWHLHT